MAGWDTRFFDDFDDNSIGIQQDPQNGTITEPVGTELVLSCSAGTQCQWSDVAQNRPCAYEEISVHEDGHNGLLRFEAKISSFTKTGVQVFAGLCLWGPTSADAYLAGWYDSNDDVYFQRLLDGTDWGTRWNGGNYGNPNTTPHIYRMYINRTPREAYISEYGETLDPYSIAFQFSANNGSSWVWPYSEALAFLPTRFGVYSRNWSSGGYRGFDAGFDHLKFEQDTDPNYYFGDQEEGTGTQDSAQTHDEMDLPGSGGPPVHGDQISKGQRIPGPPHQTIASQGPFDDVQVQEEMSLLLSGPAPTHGGEPEVGARAPYSETQVDESLIGQVVDADYLLEKDDSDGLVLLQGGTVRALVRSDTGSQDWSAPASGFYGTARDGRNYYDGEECTPYGPQGVSFGTVAGGPNRRCWSLWHKAPPMDYSDSTVPIVVSIPADDVVRFVGTGLSAQGAGIYPLWYLSGDFDVQIDFLNYSDSGGNDGGPQLIAWADPDNRLYVRRRTTAGVGENGRFDSAVRVSGSEGATYTFVDALGVTSGKFRITRVGNVVHRWYDSGGGWVELGSGVDMGRADPMYVGPDMWGNGGINLSADFSNFVINSGTVINTVAWSREPLGSHRGNANAFPSNAGLISTTDALTIVDLDTNLVWMRFVKGSGQPINPDWGGTDQWVHDVAFSSGVMVMAYHGAFVVIDFNISEVRIGRLITDTNRGARRKSTHGNGWWGLRGAGSDLNSHIVTRNQNTAFETPSLDDWAIPSRDVNSVDIWHAGGYEYRVIGTATGLRVQRWRRWYHLGSGDEHRESPDWAIWDTANEILWSKINKANGDLLWMDDTKMYSRDRTGAGQGWEDWMTGGSWASEYDKNLPGTRSFPFQYRAEIYSTFLFVPADEGVYRVNWPSGSWELFYGKPGSGATHEILPDYKLVTAIAVGNDGTDDLLIVTMEQEQRGQVVAIKLIDDTIYAKSEIVGLKVPSMVVA